MSIKVSTWVWEHSQHRGTQKMLLLALADFANDSAICWPSIPTLAKRINETDRHTRQLIQNLVASGDLLRISGGGRGNTTKYAIAVGLTDKQRDKLNTVLQNSVSQNSDSEITVLSGDINPVVQRQETLISGDLDEAPSSASQPTETAPKAGEIHHVDPSLDPITPAAPEDPRADRPSREVSTDHQKLMAAYAEWLGYKIPNGKREGAAAKKLLADGYTIEQVESAYYELKMRDFHAVQHLSLQTVYTNIGALQTKRVAKRRAEQVIGKKNGTYANGFNGYHAPTEPRLSIEEAALRSAELAKQYDPLNERGKS